MKCFQYVDGKWIFLCDISDLDSNCLDHIMPVDGCVAIKKSDGGVVLTDICNGPIRIGQ